MEVKLILVQAIVPHAPCKPKVPQPKTSTPQAPSCTATGHPKGTQASPLASSQAPEHPRRDISTHPQPPHEGCIIQGELIDTDSHADQLGPGCKL